MNYIKQLETTVARQKLALSDINRIIGAFRRFLASPKFIGQEATKRTCPSCGVESISHERKDWIATKDVDEMLVGIAEHTKVDP